MFSLRAGVSVRGVGFVSVFSLRAGVSERGVGDTSLRSLLTGVSLRGRVLVPLRGEFPCCELAGVSLDLSLRTEGEDDERSRTEFDEFEAGFCDDCPRSLRTDGVDFTLVVEFTEFLPPLVEGTTPVPVPHLRTVLGLPLYDPPE